MLKGILMILLPMLFCVFLATMCFYFINYYSRERPVSETLRKCCKEFLLDPFYYFFGCGCCKGCGESFSRQKTLLRHQQTCEEYQRLKALEESGYNFSRKKVCSLCGGSGWYAGMACIRCDGNGWTLF